MSEQVKRYDWHTDVGCMIEEKEGAWVHSDDYDALRTQVAELRAENGRKQRTIDEHVIANHKEFRRCEKMRAELEAARGLLREVLAYDKAQRIGEGFNLSGLLARIESALTATPAPEALPEQGERQEVAAYLHTLHTERAQRHSVVSQSEHHPFGVRGENYDEAYSVTTVPLYTTPQPGPDVRGLVEALEWCEDWFAKNSPTSKVDGFFPIVHPMLTSIRNALAAHRQAQQEGEKG